MKTPLLPVLPRAGIEFTCLANTLLRYQPLVILTGWYLGIGMVTRLILWAAFGRAQSVGADLVPGILSAGLLADSTQALLLLAPVGVLLWLLPDRALRSRGMRVLLLASAFAWMFAFTFNAFVEFFFFQEFDARLNLVAVDYLLYPTEVAGEIWAEYPVIAVLTGVTLVTAATLWLIRKHLLAGASTTNTTRLATRSSTFAAFVALLLTGSIWVDTAQPLDAPNRIVNELAANGVGSFVRALRTNEIDYHACYASREPRQNLSSLTTQLARGGGTFMRLPEGRLDRAFPGRSAGLGKLNVVIVASESFGAEFSKLYGSERDWTPQFDAYARKGVWFKHMYASGTRTVRGLEAITTSLPPIPSVSVLRRPGNEGMANWGEVMRAHGYDASFLYGGYGYFDNMNYFFSHNGFDVHDREDIPKPTRFENIWGVADEDLFEMALNHYDSLHRSGKPFFSLIMTTSNHRPYTFRTGVPGVKPEGGGRESGVRYADYAQGYFLREAGKHAWFDNTLFIIVADHGARVYGKENIPLKSYEIPMLFYSPKHLPPAVVDTLTTQIDIAPTMLGLLGLPYAAPFFGQDVFNTPAEHRVAFFSHNHDVAIYRDGEMSILGLNKSIANVSYDRATDTYRRAPPNVALDQLGIAYYQTAFELFRSRRYTIDERPVSHPTLVATMP